MCRKVLCMINRRLAIAEISIVAALIVAFFIFSPKAYSPDINWGLFQDIQEVSFQANGSQSDQYVAPYRLAQAFGYKRPVVAAPVVVADTPVQIEAPKQQELTALQYVGFLTGNDGKTRYMFKDKRSNKIANLFPGDSLGGYTFEAVTEDGIYRFKKDDITYILNLGF